MAVPTPVRFAVGSLGVALAAGLLTGHGQFVKPCFNVIEDINQQVGKTWVMAKTNASTRGSATTEPTTLYMMNPPLNHTGNLDAVGWRVRLQDEEASTFDQVEFQWLQFAPNGVDPDTSPAGNLLRSVQFIFWFGATGQQSMDFELTIGPPLRLRAKNHGIAVRLPAAPSWPSDGLSMHAQLNLPNDALRPRVPAPYDQQVWAFEQPGTQLTPTPLGGRVLDTLLFATLFAVDPVLQTFVVSEAYGNGPEELYGPESMHPVASRGDQLGFFLQGGNDGSAGFAFLYLSQTLLPTPFTLLGAAGNSPFIWLDPTNIFVTPLMVGLPNPQHGQHKFPTFPFSLFPPGFRDAWFQCLVYYPPSSVPPNGLIRLTDAVGVKGL
jgi:hypothetical protein